MPTIIAAESVIGEGSSVQNQTGQCAPLLSPVIGSFIVIAGDGTSVGTVIRLQCPSRHRVVSGSQISCLWSSDNAHWSGGIPECKALTRLEDKGLQLALLLSFISIVIIIFMSIIYITSCLVRHVRHEERRKMERIRRREDAKFWQQMDVDGLDPTGEALHGQKIRNNNNNNSNIKEERQHMETTISTDNQVFSHDLIRCHLQETAYT